MTKIAFCSDLHLERGTIDIKNTEKADVLVLAGDIFVSYDLQEYNEILKEVFLYKSHRYHEFIKRCCEEFPYVVMVCGNHESYNFDIVDTTNHIRKCFGYIKNFHLLDNSILEINNTLFVGGTMWSDMNGEDLETVHTIRKMMNDFRIIRNDKYRYTPEDAISNFKETVDYIDLMATIHSDKNIVVVTHHAPSFKSIDPIYEDHTILNGGYCSNLENFIIDRPNIKAWIHGHLHHKNNYILGECNVLCNPRGYINYEACADNFNLEFTEIV